jgi:hypothetical protein
MYNHTINCVIAAWRGVFIVPGGAKGMFFFKEGKMVFLWNKYRKYI